MNAMKAIPLMAQSVSKTQVLLLVLMGNIMERTKLARTAKETVLIVMRALIYVIHVKLELQKLNIFVLKGVILMIASR